MTTHVGTSGYSYPAWKGSFYPAKMPARDMLAYYAARFGTVEINNTFYRPPTPFTLAGWARQVPPGFRFVLKAPQEITHVRRLAGTAELVADLFDAAATLGGQLGAVLFQLPPTFRKDAARLADFLAGLPAGCRAAFEFRHASWFADDVFGLLRGRNAALCVADAGDDLAVPFVATADWGYLRLRRPDYDPAALTGWADRLGTAGWGEAFVFFKHEDSGQGPQLASRLAGVLAERDVRRAA